MKKLIGLALALSCVPCVLYGCGSPSSENASPDANTQEVAEESAEAEAEPEEAEPVYVDEADIPKLFSNPDAYIDQHVVLEGKIFNSVGQEDGIALYQAYYNFDSSNDVFLLGVEAGTDVAVDDYIRADCIVLGTYEGTNAFGTTITNLAVVGLEVEKLSYIDAVVPTISEIIPEGASIDQNGVTLTIDKIEFAEDETRVYFTENNNSGASFRLYSFDAVILQNGQQIEPDISSRSSYEGNYDEISDDLRSGASSSGVIVFPPFDSSADFTIELEGHSDDYHMDFEPYRFDIAALAS